MDHIFIINLVSGTANAYTILCPAIKKAASDLSISYQNIQVMQKKLQKGSQKQENKFGFTLVAEMEL